MVKLITVPNLIQILVPLFVILLVSAVTIKKRWVQARIGKNPVLLTSGRFSAEIYLKKWSFLFFPLWFGGLIVASFFPSLEPHFPHLEFPRSVGIAGLLLLYGALFLFVIALRDLKEAWRFGIDREQKTLLITTGIYGKIRHPIYTALKIAATATLFLFPNLFFLCVTVPVFVGLTFLALLEEDFLRDNFGETYENYCRKTRRFY